MNKIKLIIGVVVFSFLSLISVNTLDAAETAHPFYPYYIQNEDFADELYQEIDGIDSKTQEFTQSEFEDMANSVTKLFLVNPNRVTDVTFEGLEYFVNLEDLRISTYYLEEIPEQISDLTKLKRLNFMNNKITNISNLENLTDLDYLNMKNNELESISGLENNTKLTYLKLETNNIEKIEGLDNLTNLETLFLSMNKIEKIENLDSLINLEYLNLNFNEIYKIEGLDNLESLTTIYLYYNDISKVTDIDSIRDQLNSYMLSHQSIKVFLPKATTYDEVYQMVNCTDDTCGFDPDNYKIDEEAYTDTVSDTRYELKMYDDDDELMIVNGPGNTQSWFSAFVTINPLEKIDAIDKEENINDAANSEEELITTLEANINHSYETEINDYIYVSDFDGYDVDDPKPGVYEVTFSLSNPNEKVDIDPDFSSLDKTVTYTVYIDPEITTEDNSVHRSDAPTTDDDLVLTLSTEMIDELGQKYTEGDVLTQDYTIENYDGYDISDPQQGTYEITIKYITELGNEVTSTSVLTVYVDADIVSNNKEVMLVDAPTTEDDILLMLDTQVFDGMNNLYTGNNVLNLDNLEITDYDGYDITNLKAGMYDITITFTDENAEVVSTTSTLTVLTTPQISTKDKEVMIDEAPTNHDDLLTMMDTKVMDEMGVEHSGDDIMDLDDCIITDMDGYDVSNPEEGTYEIEVMYTDKNGNEVSCSSMLTVMADDIETGETVDPEENVDPEEPEVEITDTEEENEIKQTGISYNSILVFTLLVLVITILVKKNYKF